MTTVEEVAATVDVGTWSEVFDDARNDIKHISQLVEKDINSDYKVFPLMKNIFKAYELTDLSKVRVVIFGQDPYPAEICIDGQLVPRAQGLAFSVDPRDIVPASLRTVYQELQRSIPDFVEPDHGDLTKWTQQGVLLLNTSLTISVSRVNGKAKPPGVRWKGLISKTVRAIQEHNENVIFVLWGNHAKDLRDKDRIIDDKHYILESVHPSPMAARGVNKFIGNNHFVLINERLKKIGEPPIDWKL